MDSDVSTDQGNFPVHGIRDVRRKADTEQHDWSEQAEAPETNTLLAGRKSYIGARTRGRKSSPHATDHNQLQNRKSSVMKDDTRVGAHGDNQWQAREPLIIIIIIIIIIMGIYSAPLYS